MASMTIRNIDETIKTRLRVRAAQHGRSMEDEARDILRSALSTSEPRLDNLFDAIRRDFADTGFIDLPEIPRETMREPIDFS